MRTVNVIADSRQYFDLHPYPDRQQLVNSIEDAIQDGKSSFADIREDVKDRYETIKGYAEKLLKC